MFADATRKHMSQSMVIINKPGASGAIGWTDVINAKPDGYKLAVLTVELPRCRTWASPSSTTTTSSRSRSSTPTRPRSPCKADSPWNTIEEFLAAAKKQPGEMRVGNAGNGSIWHLAAAALEDKTGVKFNHVPFQGAAPAVLALLGGHIDAVAVSPAEVDDARAAAASSRCWRSWPTSASRPSTRCRPLKERGIDLSIGTWRGLAAPKNTPPE